MASQQTTKAKPMLESKFAVQQTYAHAVSTSIETAGCAALQQAVQHFFFWQRCASKWNRFSFVGRL
jgi:hypothetical protein